MLILLPPPLTVQCGVANNKILGELGSKPSRQRSRNRIFSLSFGHRDYFGVSQG